MTKRDRWILSEYRVAREREAKFSETMFAHRMRTPYAEIDLVFESRSGYTIIEVKSVGDDLWGRPPLTRGQRLRLERARLWFESRSRRRVRLLLACVTNRGAITYFEAPF